MKRIAYLAATVAFMAASTAQAAIDPEALGRDWWSQGYTSIEVTVGRSQVKVEGIRDGQKVEAIYDAATGAELKRETGAVEAGDDIHNGISIRQRNRDFVRDDSRDDDDDHSGSGAGDDDSNDDNSGSGNDDDGNDDHGDDHGSDDHGGDDHGGHGSDDGADHDSGDDHGGDRGGDDD